MRRLSMKNKRKISEAASDSEAEENGVTRAASANNTDEAKKEENAEDGKSISAEKSMNATKNASKRRTSRGRSSQKGTTEERNVEDESDKNEAQAASDGEEENGSVAKGGASKRRKKEEQKASTSTNDQDTGSEKEYEVERVVGHRTIKGRRQFLIRWKGYNESSDTWEQETSLKCGNLIEDYLADIEDQEDNAETKSEVHAKGAKGKSQKKEEKKTKKSKASSRKQTDNGKEASKHDDDEGEKESQKEFEVEKIIEVHFKKNKGREFLIRWKGFSSSDDTWEPEENLNCPELIEKFMQKVERAKTTEMRELRQNRAHTKRYTLATHETGRRLSRRNMDKQRATYHECDT